MKKYVKPDLIYEQYELTQHIAADCAWDMQMSDRNSCVAVEDEDYFGYSNSDNILFTEHPRCTIIDPEMYCYQNSTDGKPPAFRS